jgi:hypothetical protein
MIPAFLFTDALKPPTSLLCRKDKRHAHLVTEATWHTPQKPPNF